VPWDRSYPLSSSFVRICKKRKQNVLVNIKPYPQRFAPQAFCANFLSSTESPGGNKLLEAGRFSLVRVVLVFPEAVVRFGASEEGLGEEAGMDSS
jgi:hypothetical protein